MTAEPMTPSTGRAGRRRHGPLAAPIRQKGVVTIPQAVRDELELHEGDNLLVSVRDGSIVLTPATLVPRDQEWFWTPEWQAKEHEVDQALAHGERGEIYVSDTDFLQALDGKLGDG